MGDLVAMKRREHGERGTSVASTDVHRFANPLIVELPDAACIGEADLFGDEILDIPSISVMRSPGGRQIASRQRSEQIAKAIAVCHSCAVLEQCRDLASRVVMFGVAGGLPPEDPARAHHNSSPPSASPHSKPAPTAVDPARVLQLLEQGLDSREVAAEVGCSDRTVRRIVMRTAIRQAPVPPIEDIPFLSDLPVYKPNEVAYFRTDGPEQPADAPERPEAPVMPAAVEMSSLPNGRTLHASFDRLPACMVALLDLFIPGSPLARDEILEATSGYVSTGLALATWSSTASQPTSDSNVRVLPPGMGAVKYEDRVSRGARSYMLTRIQSLIDSRCLLPTSDGFFTISRQALGDWLRYRYSPHGEGQLSLDFLAS